jgi:hypothetical protein
MTSTLADHWAALATAALLGTDRRPPPAPPPGPLEDLLAALPPADDAQRALHQVVAIAAARRAGLRPAPPTPTLHAVSHDHRRPCPPAAARRLPELVQHWPMLVAPWLELLDQGGFALPPEHLVDLLERERANPVTRAVVLRIAGPLAEWVAQLFPDLQAGPRSAASPDLAAASPDPAASGALPPDLAALVTAPADQLVAVLVDGLATGSLANRHRPLLIRLVCQVPASVLPALVTALARSAPRPEAAGLTFTLAELAAARSEMIAELTGAGADDTDERGTSPFHGVGAMAAATKETP